MPVYINLYEEQKNIRTPADFRSFLRKIEWARAHQMKAGGWKCPVCSDPIVTRVFPDPEHPHGGRSISCCSRCFWTQTWDFLVDEGATVFESARVKR